MIQLWGFSRRAFYCEMTSRPDRVILPSLRKNREKRRVGSGWGSSLQHAKRPCFVVSTSGQFVENNGNKSAAFREADPCFCWSFWLRSAQLEQSCSLIFVWGKTLPHHCPSAPTSGSERLSGGLGMGAEGRGPTSCVY